MNVSALLRALPISGIEAQWLVQQTTLCQGKSIRFYEPPAGLMNALSVSDWPTTDKRDKHLSQIIFLQKNTITMFFSL